MKASEMTNAELANDLEKAVGFPTSGDAVILLEAAARLRDVSRIGYDKVVADLRRRLKVAEDALETIYKCVDNRRDVDVSILVKYILVFALDAIRKEGGAR